MVLRASTPQDSLRFGVERVTRSFSVSVSMAERVRHKGMCKHLCELFLTLPEEQALRIVRIREWLNLRSLKFNILMT